MSEMKKEIERSILRYFKDKKMDEHAKTTDLHNLIRMSDGLFAIKLFLIILLIIRDFYSFDGLLEW